MRLRRTISFETVCLLLLCSAFASCHKNNNGPNVDELPPITAKGANTFGCLLNGQVWVPYSSCEGNVPALLYNTPKLDIPNYSTYFEVHAYNSVYPNLGDDLWTISPIDYFFYGIHGTGNYIDSLDIEFDGSGATYNLIYPYHGPRNFTVTTFDTVNHIIAGTFAFSLYYYPGGGPYVDSIVISEGRFDFQMTATYSTCN
jgi:hypothetical protein